MRQYCTGASQEVVTSSQTKSDAMTVKLTSKKYKTPTHVPQENSGALAVTLIFVETQMRLYQLLPLQLYQVTVTATVTVTTAASAAATVATILTASV